MEIENRSFRNIAENIKSSISKYHWKYRNIFENRIIIRIEVSLEMEKGRSYQNIVENKILFLSKIHYKSNVEQIKNSLISMFYTSIFFRYGNLDFSKYRSIDMLENRASLHECTHTFVENGRWKIFWAQKVIWQHWDNLRTCMKHCFSIAMLYTYQISNYHIIHILRISLYMKMRSKWSKCSCWRSSFDIGDDNLKFNSVAYFYTPEG